MKSGNQDSSICRCIASKVSRNLLYLTVFCAAIICLLVLNQLLYRAKHETFHDHCATWTNETDVVIPNDEELKLMSLYGISCLFRRYVTSLQRLCTEPKRFGDVDYGGVRICTDKGVAPRPGCVIYSYNHDLSQRFKDQVDKTFKCDVIFFGKDILSSNYDRLGGFNKVLASHQKVISVVVMKLNSRDFPFLQQFIHNLDKVQVKQIILELHLDPNLETKSDYFQIMNALRRLHESNYFKYWYDRNWNCVGNEKKKNRYSKCWTINMFLRNREETDIAMSKGSDLPDIAPLGTSSIDENEKKKYKTEYLKYISKHQILCKQMLRLGNIVDGGWDICHDVQFRPKPPCIVYSFGINYDFSFDEDMEKTYGCHVFCFDPSMKTADYKHSDHISFYNVGLGDTNKEITVNNEKWKLKTLRTLQEELGHTNRRIDVLKIDIEGNEISSLPEMISSGALKNVVQLCLEFHHYYDLGSLRKLYDIGFRIFWAHQNPYTAFYANGETLSYGMEVYFVNINLAANLTNPLVRTN